MSDRPAPSPPDDLLARVQENDDFMRRMGMLTRSDLDALEAEWEKTLPEDGEGAADALGRLLAHSPKLLLMAGEYLTVQEIYAGVMREACDVEMGGDYVHCSCVPHLREGVRNLTAENARLRSELARLTGPRGPLISESYWCGCIRLARWTRCERHGHLDHDDEPPTQAEEAR
jgi:hypothetical protein